MWIPLLSGIVDEVFILQARRARCVMFRSNFGEERLQLIGRNVSYLLFL